MMTEKTFLELVRVLPLPLVVGTTPIGKLPIPMGPQPAGRGYQVRLFALAGIAKDKELPDGVEAIRDETGLASVEAIRSDIPIISFILHEVRVNKKHGDMALPNAFQKAQKQASKFASILFGVLGEGNAMIMAEPTPGFDGKEKR